MKLYYSLHFIIKKSKTQNKKDILEIKIVKKNTEVYKLFSLTNKQITYYIFFSKDLCEILQ